MLYCLWHQHGKQKGLISSRGVFSHQHPTFIRKYGPSIIANPSIQLFHLCLYYVFERQPLRLVAVSSPLPVCLEYCCTCFAFITQLTSPSIRQRIVHISQNSLRIPIRTRSGYHNPKLIERVTSLGPKVRTLSNPRAYQISRSSCPIHHLQVQVRNPQLPPHLNPMPHSHLVPRQPLAHLLPSNQPLPTHHRSHPAHLEQEATMGGRTKEAPHSRMALVASQAFNRDP